MAADAAVNALMAAAQAAGARAAIRAAARLAEQLGASDGVTARADGADVVASGRGLFRRRISDAALRHLAGGGS